MKTAYINGILLDGQKEMQPLSHKIIVTEGEKIIKICDDSIALGQMEIVDLKGQYILPGLINLHVHLPASGKPTKKASNPKKLVKLMTSNPILEGVMHKLCASYAATQLYSGVTTIRTVGGVKDTDTIIRDRIASGKIVGPRILAANMAISVPEGHMAGSLAYEAKSANEASEYVEKIAQEKPDLIKLMITGGVLDAKVEGEPGVLKMDYQLVKAACDKAHEYHLPVAAHVESPEGVKVALKGGVDTIEHGAKPDEETIQLFHEKGASLVATLSPALPYALFDREISHVSKMEQVNGKVVFDGIIECARTCLKEGIPVGIGTDTGCPYITHYDFWREMNYFQKYCGVSNSFAIYTATLQNAKIAGIDAITGSIEEGKCADFVVVHDNPLDSLLTLRTPTMVVARGKRFEHPKVKKMNEVEVELDKFL